MRKQIARLTALLAVCTLLPLAGMAERTFAIDPQVEFNGGYTTVRWSDSEEGHEYIVGYQPYAAGDAVQTAYWAGGDRESSTTADRAFTFSTLLPGHAYTVEVMEENGGHVAETIVIPAAESFQDGRLAASAIRTTITPMVKRTLYSNPQEEKALVAQKIAESMGTREYGLRYTISMPELGADRTYLTQVVLTAPNGYTETVVTQTYTFRKQSGRTSYSLYIGFDFFRRLCDKNNGVPTGAYTAELFFDGMLVNVRTFNVQ